MKKTTFLILLAISSTLAFAAGGTLTETYSKIVQTSAAAANTKWNGDYFEWTVNNIRRNATDTLKDSGGQGGWFSSPAYVRSSNPIEGGIKALSFPWSQFGNESTRMLKMVIIVDGIRVDSIVQQGVANATGTQKTYSKNNINCKKNATLYIENLSYTSAKQTELGGRFVLGNITWTPYLYYTTKFVAVSRGNTHTNTALINNLDVDMAAPTYTSSHPAYATVNASTGAVTAIAEGTTTITATSGNVSTTYKFTVKPANWKMETFDNEVTTAYYSNPLQAVAGLQASWTCFLGGIQKGGSAFAGATNGAAYVKAKYQGTSDYGYLQSSTISGGIDSLSFAWNSNGAEAATTWDIRILINGNQVYQFTQAGNAAILAVPDTIKIGGLKIQGDFTLKFENRSTTTDVYTSGNKGRFAIDNLQWVGYTTIVRVSTSTNTSLLSLTPASDVKVSNGAILTVNTPTTINSLTIDAGGQTTNANTLSASSLIINSDATHGTGTYLDNGTTTVTNYTVNQSLTDIRNWYLSSPITNANAPSNYTYYKYLEPGLLSGQNTTYWAPVNQGDAFEKGRGYIALPGSIASPISFSTSTGTLNKGDVTVGLTRTGAVKTGFNLVGNPYPSHITLTKAITDGSNLLNTIWYRTANYDEVTAKYIYEFQTCLMNANGTYVGVPEGTTAVIPPMQAFWVKLNSGTSGSLTFTNAMRSHQTSNLLKSKAMKNSTLKTLRLKVSNAGTNDEAVIYFSNDASNEYDEFDAPKMSNGNASVPEIFTSAGSEQLVINGMKTIPYDTELPLGFTTGEANSFTIKASQFTNFEAGTRVLLKDNLVSNNPVDLTEGGVYSFTSGVTVNNTNRFSLIFKAPSVANGIWSFNDNQNISVYCNGNNQITIKSNGIVNSENFVSIYNTLGHKMVTEVLKNTITVLRGNYTAGVYFVTVSANGKTSTQKVVVN